MPKAKSGRGRKFYAVRIGRQPGVYETWAETEIQVTGFPGASHKSFPNRQEAEIYVGTSLQAIGGNKKPVKPLESQTGTGSGVGGPSIDHYLVGRAMPKPHATVSDGADSAPILSPEQQSVLERIIAGENIFFTGPAGTGKSVLLRAVISAFREKQREAESSIGQAWRSVDEMLTGDDGRSIRKRWRLGITASTGMAAVNIGGCTVHSWAGIGLGKLSIDRLHGMVLRSKLALKRWRETDALVIDELSMIPASLLDTLDSLARLLRHSDVPFGGIQVIASGDFYQLPPVPDRVDPSADNLSNTQLSPKFAFESSCWPSLFPSSSVISLSRVYRQSDSTFVSLLERLRKGSVSTSDLHLIKTCDRIVQYPDGIEPVSLLASKKEVAAINALRLDKLPDAVQEFMAFDEPGVNGKGWNLTAEEATTLLIRNTIWADKLALKIGALVMLVTNMQDGHLVNGSTGLVTAFLTPSEAMQGGIYIPERALYLSPDDKVKWPVVEFAVPQHASVPSTQLASHFSGGSRAGTASQRPHTRTALIPQMSVSVTNALGTPEAIRHQIPLILAWGMTIHKAQGQSIHRLRVDLSKIFERGQTYVALSRATSLETLEIRNFSPDKVMSHQKVIEWSRPMEEEQAMDAEWDALLGDTDLGYQ